jgi:hypothetical protein
VRKLISILSIVTFVFTVFWLALLLLGLRVNGVSRGLEQIVANGAQLDTLWYATYLNAVCVTLAATMLFAVLYGFFRREAPAYAVLGFVFVPVYCVFNLTVYRVQITLVPNLLALYQTSEFQNTATVLLSQVLQPLPTSTLSVLNNFAYALLGIPSVIFGILLLNHGTAGRIAGTLFAFNGVACVLGWLGALFNVSFLAFGSVIGGVLFLGALVPLALAFQNGAREHPALEFEARLHVG